MKLIINADDFGRTREINRAVVRAHEEGILTSASLMVAGEASADAVRLAREHPSLAVGLHVVVVDGASAIPGAPPFPNAPLRLGLRYAFSRRARMRLADELRAQFERFAATGLRLSHVDGHQHMHMHPAVFDMILPLAREFGARGIRIVRDDFRLALRFDHWNAMVKLSSAAVFALLARRCRRRCAGTELQCARRTFGFFRTGAMRVPYVLEIIKELAESGLTSAEIYFHPTCGGRLDALGPNPGDLASLISPSVRAAVREAGLHLSTYFDLPESAPLHEAKGAFAAVHAR